MRTALADGESLQRDDKCNMERGFNVLGGHLYLTNHRLIFESHGVMQREIEVALTHANIDSVETAFIRLLKIIPMADTALLVSTTDGAGYRFAMPDRQSWLLALRHLSGPQRNVQLRE